MIDRLSGNDALNPLLLVGQGILLLSRLLEHFREHLAIFQVLAFLLSV
jgi:hypothetical protein